MVDLAANTVPDFLAYTFNIRGLTGRITGPNKLKWVNRRLVRELKADIILLQELKLNSPAEVKARFLPYKGQLRGLAYCDDSRGFR